MPASTAVGATASVFSPTKTAAVTAYSPSIWPGSGSSVSVPSGAASQARVWRSSGERPTEVKNTQAPSPRTALTPKLPPVWAAQSSGSACQVAPLSAEVSRVTSVGSVDSSRA